MYGLQTRNPRVEQSLSVGHRPEKHALGLALEAVGDILCCACGWLWSGRIGSPPHFLDRPTESQLSPLGCQAMALGALSLNFPSSCGFCFWCSWYQMCPEGFGNLLVPNDVINHFMVKTQI